VMTSGREVCGTCLPSGAHHAAVAVDRRHGLLHAIGHAAEYLARSVRAAVFDVRGPPASLLTVSGEVRT
jgi:hypothetical protein